MQTEVHANDLLADDYSTSRVPLSARTPMLDVLWVQLGIVTAMSEFVAESGRGEGLSPFGDEICQVATGRGVEYGAKWRQNRKSQSLWSWCGFPRPTLALGSFGHRKDEIAILFHAFSELNYVGTPHTRVAKECESKPCLGTYWMMCFELSDLLVRPRMESV